MSECVICYEKLTNKVFVECNNEKCDCRVCSECYFKYPILCPVCRVKRRVPHKIVTGKSLYSALKRRWKKMGFAITIDHMGCINVDLLHYLKVCPLEEKGIPGVIKLLEECPHDVAFHVMPHDGRADTSIYGLNLKGVLVTFEHSDRFLVVFFL